jgi:hypothetical protein
MRDQPTDPTTLIHEPATDCQTYPAIDALKPGSLTRTGRPVVIFSPGTGNPAGPGGGGND